MHANWRHLLFTVALVVALLPAGLRAQQALTTYTGRVSDSMCGAKHMMAGNAAQCTRMCVKGGSSYALVIGSRVYTLSTTKASQLAALNKFAGEMVSVKGTLKGKTLTVDSIAARN